MARSSAKQNRISASKRRNLRGKLSRSPEKTWREIQNWKGSCYAHLDEVVGGDGIANNKGTSHEERNLPRDASIQTTYDSICFNSLMSGSGNTRDRNVPPYVICLAMFTIGDARQNQRQQQQQQQQQQQKKKRRFMHHNPVRLSWSLESPYLEFFDQMVAFVNQLEPEAKNSYLKIGRVQLRQWSGHRFELADTCVIENREDWARRVPHMIAMHCACRTQRPLPFYLEIHSDFEYFHLDSYDIDEIQRVLEDTQLKNFREKTFWSKKFLKQLFDRTTVSQIVTTYVSNEVMRPRMTRKQLQENALSLENSDQFVDWILSDRIRLFATIIRCDIGIDDFYKLTREGRDDIKDDRIPLDEKILKTFLRPAHVDAFKSIQKGFKPYNFPNPEPEPDEDIEGDTSKIDQLVPMYYTTADKIGEGGYGDVYKVTIHPDFHAFSPDRNKVLALKVISDTIYNSATNEVKVWQLVAKIPHPHITPLYASWLQKDHCFMLSPLADQSLQDLLNSECTFNIEDTEWLLEQLEGLMAGIHHIHHIGRISLDGPKKLKQLRWFDCGYHHDLKPANILIFNKVWKVGDFGTARIRELVSGKVQALSLHTDGCAGGDSEYEGPDRYLDSPHVGRAYDIWSFGCILLEVLLWAFGRGGQYLKDFQKARADDPCNDCSCPTSDSTDKDNVPNTCLDKNCKSDNTCGGPGFWYRCKKGKGDFHLKLCVRQNLDWVRNQAMKTERYSLLLHLCERATQMLSIKPSDRPSASDIKDRIGELRFRANFHFRHKDLDLNLEIATQPDMHLVPGSRRTTPAHSESQDRSGKQQDISSATNPHKRKADLLDTSQGFSLAPTSEGFKHMGNHLDQESHNVARQPTRSTSHHERSTKKPRLLGSKPSATIRDTALSSLAEDTASSPSPSLADTTVSSGSLDTDGPLSGPQKPSKGVTKASLTKFVKHSNDPTFAERTADEESIGKLRASRTWDR